MLKTCKHTLFMLLLVLCGCYSTHAQSIYAYGYTFSAFAKPYTYLNGGTPITAIQVDDNYATVPIGFTFTFCGIDYTDVTICSNGWIRFGTGTGAAPANWNYNPTPSLSPYPAVYFLYEDITGDYATATYKTTGTAPNRVFTFEMKSIAWDYQSTSPCVSAQVNLYETTGVIECQYKKEGGSVALNSSGGATIGIHNTLSDYQTLDGVGAAPVSSSSIWTSNLSATPATNQCYKWDPGPPCVQPTALAMTNIASKSASFGWTAAPGTYEYIVNQTSTPPTVAGTTTTTNSAIVTGLTPSTNYFVHVRVKCSAVSFSKWTTIGFTTRPDCSKPGAVTIVYIDTNAVTLQWPTVTPAYEYQYVINTTRANPTSSAGTSATTSPVINKNGLTEGTWYYVHYRSRCLGNDSSAWALDSFRTPVPCRKPQIALTHLSSGNSITSWPAVNTAYQYEYYLGPLTTLPPNGTPIITNYVQTPYLVPNTGYTMSVRCLCNDFGAKSVSPWSSIDFTTPPPAGVGTVGYEKSIVIFPNPTHEKVFINTNGMRVNNASVSITDINGRVVLHSVISKDVSEINVSALAKGIYIVKYTDDMHTETQKLSIE